MKKILIAMLLCLSVGMASACISEAPTSSSLENSTPEQTSSSVEDSSIESVESSDEVSEDSESVDESSKEESTGGEEGDSNVCKITFAQEGQETITRYVNKGESLLDIPTVQPVVGYDVVWSVTDFTNVQGDIQVKAVKTPKTYVITYKVEESGAQISATEQKVSYLAEYELLTPTRAGYRFDGWKIEGESELFDSEGVYSYTEDITLVPEWKWIEGVWVE